LVERGDVEAIVMNASGCGVTVKEYGHALARDPAYAEKAQRVSGLTRDLSELLPSLVPALQGKVQAGEALLAFHPPCTLQHGQQLHGLVERGMGELGFTVRTTMAESHLCCGSAGTYSILHSGIAHELRDRKLGHLHDLKPQAIVSANIGCIAHLQGGTETPVKHWVEVLDKALKSS
jgi:glycolate oxidase iron-sulfur subunit